MKKSGKGVCLFQLIPKKEFKTLCDRHKINKGTRSLTAQIQVWALVQAYVLKLDSLREIELVLKIPRSTLSDANINRKSSFFEELCRLVLWKIQEEMKGGRKIKRAIRTYLAIDSTEINVNGRLSKLFKWKQKHSRTNKASAKLHAVWNVDEEWIDDFIITAGRVHDAQAAKMFKFKPKCTYIFDRAYNEFLFWWKIVEAKAHFVSRLKKCSYSKWRRKLILKENEDKVGVIWDDEWKPSYPVLRKLPFVAKDFKLRRIIYKDPETKKVFDFITSDFEISGQEVADIYKRRWAVELLFRWLKGHLGIRAIDARDTNAAEVQLAMAVLVQLLVRLYRQITKFRGTLWECLRLLRAEVVRAGPLPRFIL